MSRVQIRDERHGAGAQVVYQLAVVILPGVPVEKITPVTSKHGTRHSNVDAAKIAARNILDEAPIGCVAVSIAHYYQLAHDMGEIGRPIQ